MSNDLEDPDQDEDGDNSQTTDKNENTDENNRDDGRGIWTRLKLVLEVALLVAKLIRVL